MSDQGTCPMCGRAFVVTGYARSRSVGRPDQTVPASYGCPNRCEVTTDPGTYQRALLRRDGQGSRS